MKRYIDADKLLYKLNSDDTLKHARHLIKCYVEETPTADVKEVVRGEWIDYLPSPDWVRDDGKTVFLECSECHKTFCRNFFPADSRNFCPNCGADMRGEVE